MKSSFLCLSVFLSFFILVLSGCKVNRQVGDPNSSGGKPVKPRPDSLNTAVYIRSNKLFVDSMQRNPLYRNNFTGVCVYDMEKKDYIIQYNHDKYFTPASNIKLFTFYAGLTLLGDRAPALYWINRRDSLIIWGTGNPALLHPVLKDSTALLFLKQSKQKIFYSNTNFADQPFGPGWAWDDYVYDFSAEKSALPMYGNVVNFVFAPGKAPLVQPAYFTPFVRQDRSLGNFSVQRAWRSNDFRYFAADSAQVKQTRTLEIPFISSPELTVKLLEKTLNRQLGLIDYKIPKEFATLYGIHMDSIYKKMLQDSDNFLAEQILLMCAAQMNQSDSTPGVIKAERVINHLLRTQLADLSEKPRWVDGSGLSRMNLVSPHAMVELLLKIHARMLSKPQGEQLLFDLLPTGGKTGTLRNWYKNSTPFVHAKTGTLSNNHNLSGFLITKSGKKLCFSFMNNHYMETTTNIRREMEKILTAFYLYY